jgi:hypothetical protein
MRAPSRVSKPSISDFSGLRAVGVTPEYARALIAAGFRQLLPMS